MKLALTVVCPVCHAPVGQECDRPFVTEKRSHKERHGLALQYENRKEVYDRRYRESTSNAGRVS